ncbi:MAG: M18 family aminopeptidase [Clostridia bacterium]|nr:M18 family aminopeptidase [Clostridia bacterium]
MLNEMLDFLASSHSAFHAVKNIKQLLSDGGFTELRECDLWQIEKGGRYYVTRNLSSVIAFIIPEDEPDCFMLTASHCDSPVFKIKENAELEVKGKYIQLDTERYGGAILTSWLDRPLSFAGRVLVKTDKGVETRLVDMDKDSLIVPNVAPHMKRDINDGMKYNLQTDMVPLYGDFSAKGSFRRTVAELAHASEEDVLGHDLYLYNRVKPTRWGARNEFISSGRLDDLECAFTTAKAFTLAKPSRAIAVCAVFDNEEVGSTTKQGADSTFLTDVLGRISGSLGIGGEKFQQMRASSLMLSCVNAHAVHPNHPEFSDSANCVYMNEGIVIKESANQKYTSDGVSKALLRYILERANVPVQFYSNRSDMPGGGTLGNISNSHFSLNTVDIGLCQLSMHSTYETAGAFDVEHMINGMKAFFEASVIATDDGRYEVR